MSSTWRGLRLLRALFTFENPQKPATVQPIRTVRTSGHPQYCGDCGPFARRSVKNRDIRLPPVAYRPLIPVQITPCYEVRSAHEVASCDSCHSRRDRRRPRRRYPGGGIPPNDPCCRTCAGMSSYLATPTNSHIVTSPCSSSTSSPSFDFLRSGEQE